MSEGIRLFRRPSFVYCLRKFGVIVDDKKVGAIANGKDEIYTLPPGRHDVKMKVGWCKSKTVTVDVLPGNVVNLECGTPIGRAYFLSMGAVILLAVLFRNTVGLAGSLAAIVIGIYWVVRSFQEESFVYLRPSTGLIKD